MRILYITHRVPYPPDKGDRIRSFHTLRHLARRHSIRLACLAWSAAEQEQAESLRDYCDSIDVVPMRPLWSKVKSLLYLFSSKPLTLPYFYSKKLHRLIDGCLRRGEVDAILTFSSSMAQYLAADEARPKIIDFVDVDSDKWLQYAEHVKFPFFLLYRLEGKRLRKYEISLASRYDCCTVISEAEARLFRSYSEQFALRTVPNGVDLDYFQTSREDFDRWNLIFTGVMDYYANVDGVLWFHDEVLPLILKRVPRASFTIVGGNPTRAVRRLGRNEHVSVTGRVQDIRPFLKNAAVCVVPLRIARGVQNKVLEAMAMGLPVVATPQAAEGIDALSGRDLLVADGVADFAAKTVQLLLDPQLQGNVSRNARQLVEAKYRWEECLESLDQIIDHLSRRSPETMGFPPKVCSQNAP